MTATVNIKYAHIELNSSIFTSLLSDQFSICLHQRKNDGHLDPLLIETIKFLIHYYIHKIGF